jgi:hypothetical protein
MATDHTWRGGIPVVTAPNRRRTPVDLRRGCCVLCRHNLFVGQPIVPAPRPLLGRVHQWCADGEQG